jgi:hypothetical protein
VELLLVVVVVRSSEELELELVELLPRDRELLCQHQRHVATIVMPPPYPSLEASGYTSEMTQCQHQASGRRADSVAMWPMAVYCPPPLLMHSLCMQHQVI